jgi:hypothetical protein
MHRKIVSFPHFLSNKIENRLQDPDPKLLKPTKKIKTLPHETTNLNQGAKGYVNITFWVGFEFGLRWPKRGGGRF